MYKVKLNAGCNGKHNTVHSWLNSPWFKADMEEAMEPAGTRTEEEEGTIIVC
jgi:hypothetical protein